MYSLRGWLRAKDGQIHTDSKDKIITVLLYLNENWPHAGGRLRLLRNGTDLENFVTEVPPDNGTASGGAWSSPIRGQTPGIADELDDQRGQ